MPLTLASRPWRAKSLPRRGLLASVLPGLEPLASWRDLSKVIERLSSSASRLKMAINVAAVSPALLPASLPGIMGRQRQLRGALVKHQDRLGAPAKHEVGLPIAELPATHDPFGSLVDRHLVCRIWRSLIVPLVSRRLRRPRLALPRGSSFQSLSAFCRAR